MLTCDLDRETPENLVIGVQRRHRHMKVVRFGFEQDSVWNLGAVLCGKALTVWLTEEVLYLSVKFF